MVDDMKKTRTRTRAATCAYCAGKGEMSREHVLPRWARRLLGGYECFVPRRTKHPWGGEPVVTDVCAACNSGPLSRLDKAASCIYLALDAGSTTLDAADASDLGKWSVKVAYNSHRAARVDGALGNEPGFPPSAGRWAAGLDPTCRAVAACVATIPAEERLQSVRAGIYSFGEVGLACRYICLPAVVLYVVWDMPGFPAGSYARWLCGRAPAARLDGAGATLPELRDAAALHRGLFRRGSS